MLKTDDIIWVNLATFAYKAWNGLLPNAFNDYLICNSDIHHYNTRSSGNAHYNRYNSTMGMLSLRARTIKTWNSLSDNITNKPSAKSFRRNFIQKIIASY